MTSRLFFFKTGEADGDASMPEVLGTNGANLAQLARMAKLEQAAGKCFGDASNPLLISVRSGAPVSMPGMMETVLNLGINDEIVKNLEEHGGERFAFDTYRRFLEMYLQAVCGQPLLVVEQPLSQIKQARGIDDDASLDGEALREVVRLLKELHRDKMGYDVPQNPHDRCIEKLE